MAIVYFDCFLSLYCYQWFGVFVFTCFKVVFVCIVSFFFLLFDGCCNISLHNAFSRNAVLLYLFKTLETLLRKWLHKYTHSCQMYRAKHTFRLKTISPMLHLQNTHRLLLQYGVDMEAERDAIIACLKMLNYFRLDLH